MVVSHRHTGAVGETSPHVHTRTVTMPTCSDAIWRKGSVIEDAEWGYTAVPDEGKVR